MALRFSPARGSTSIVLNANVRGPQGAAGTLAVGSVTSLTPGTTPTVVNSGTNSAAILNFGIPTSKTVAVGTTTTGAEGTSASVTDSGDASGSVFNFTIPRGAVPAVEYSFSTTTTDSDPGNGNVRFNNATPASITTVYFDNLDRFGNTVTGWLDSFDDSTNTAKGTLTVKDVATPSLQMIFAVSGSVVDGTGYRKVTVTWVSGATLFTNANSIAFGFARTGDKGIDGSVAGPGVSVDSEVALWSGTGGATLKRATGSGIAKLTSGVLGTATSGTDYAPATSGSTILKGNGSGGFSSATASADYLSPTNAAQLSAGFYDADSDQGTKSSGTFTPDPSSMPNIVKYTNGGAHTLAPWTATGKNATMFIDIINGGSSGAVTTSGWTKVDGDTIDTTSTSKFRGYASVGPAGSHLNIKKMA